MGLLSSLLSLLFIGLLLELGVRAWNAWRTHFSSRAYAAMLLDDRLGWKPMPSFARDGTRTDASGHSYPVIMHVDKDGFRRYRSDSPRGKLFVLGDSFTWAVDAGDDDTYYAHLHRQLGLDVDAFGVGGYGTMQEYLVLDEYIDRIHPSAILLQLFSNDFVNNDYALEIQSTQNNNSMRRPYLGPDDSVVYAFPCGFPSGAPWLRDFANRHSKFLYLLFSRIDQRRAAKTDSIEDRALRGDSEAIRLYEESAAITGRLLKKIRQRVPQDIPVFAFSIDTTGTFADRLPGLCAEAGLIWIDGVAQAVQNAEQTGAVVRAADGIHWNPRGHALAAGVLAPAIGGYLKN